MKRLIERQDTPFTHGRAQAAREERGMSQEELARFIYRTRVTVSDMERGRVRVSTQDLALIGAGLEKPITHFSAVLTGAEGGQLTPEERNPMRKVQ